MKNVLVEKYMDKIKNMNEKEYLFGVISYGIAPTLTGQKPSSIITLGKDSRGLSMLWEKYKKAFQQKYELSFYELRTNDKAVTILFYYNNELNKAIYDEDNMRFLKKFGYSKELDLRQNLSILKERFEKACPHEIGVFLGFPLDDVICFMEQPDRQCLLCGYWKVYNDLDLAKEKFSNYDMAKHNIAQQVIQGVAPSLLINILEKDTMFISF